MLAGPDAPALRSAWNRLTRLDLHLIFGLADLRYLLDPPENPYVRHVPLEEFGWYGQRRMAQSVVENRDSPFKAAHNVSKLQTVAVSEPMHGWVRCRRAR